jgi:hypothetical protein
MQLQYLDFEFSDEDSGRGSFDAMASVLPDRLPALLGEIAAVLRWAERAFGPAGPAGDEGDWDFDLQGVAEPDAPLELAWVRATAEVTLAPQPAGRSTLTLTLSGSPAFCAGLRAAFDLED